MRRAALATMAATLPAAAWSAGPAPDATRWRPAWATTVQDSPKEETLRVLSYTPEHCRELALRASALRARARAPHPQAALLASEGERLCAHGHYRPGIVRLRRAVLLLRDETPR
jgi:hypothetical protein